MTLPFAGHPVGARSATEAKNDQDKIAVGVPVPAGRPVAVRQERPHHAGARRGERIEGALRDGHVLVRPARRVAREDRRAAGRRCGERAGARLPLAAGVGAVRDHVAVRVGRRYARTSKEIYPGADATRPHDDRHERVHAEARAGQPRACCCGGSWTTSIPNQRAEVFVADASDARSRRRTRIQAGGRLVSRPGRTRASSPGRRRSSTRRSTSCRRRTGGSGTTSSSCRAS